MKKITYQKQVESEHYDFKKYVHLDRWISYYYQIKEVTDLASRLEKKSLTILEIGVGNKITTSVLKQLGHKVKTLDIDPSLKPDYVGTLPDLKVVRGKHFDCVLSFEVLEHIKSSDVELALKNIGKISDNVIISVPNKGLSLSFTIKFWFFKPLSIFLSFPTSFMKYKFNGEHYWEIGTKNTNLPWLVKIINNSGFVIINNYRLSENPYHRFMVLEKVTNQKLKKKQIYEK